MVVRLLVVDTDVHYLERLTGVLTKDYSGTYQLEMVTTTETFIERLKEKQYDIALMGTAVAQAPMDLSSVKLSVLLVGEEPIPPEIPDMPVIQKYQRISMISSEILRHYAKLAPVHHFSEKETQTTITAVYSPAGGTGKTSVAIAYCMFMAALNKNIFYLDMECFGSTSLFFGSEAKSLSDILEMLIPKKTKENEQVQNKKLMLNAAKKQDPKTNVFYYSIPKNYDDINAMTVEEVEQLLHVMQSGSLCDELVIDLSCVCDKKTQYILEKASRIYLVSDPSPLTASKLKQFMTQHNVFESVRSKVTLVVNKGGNGGNEGNENFADPDFVSHVFLPQVNTANPMAVCKELSRHIPQGI